MIRLVISCFRFSSRATFFMIMHCVVFACAGTRLE